MPVPATSMLLPRTHQFAIGEQVGSADTLIGVLERLNAPTVDVIHGLAVNHGRSSFTLSVTTGKCSTGSLTFSGQPTDGNTIVIDDGPNAAVTFEFDNNASVTESATLRQVLIAATLQQTVANLVAAIKNAPTLNVTPLEPFQIRSTNDVVVDLVNDLSGTAGNVTITETGTVCTAAGLSGGTGAAKNIRVNASGTPAAVASVVVLPGARVPFTIEIGPSDVQDFYNFLAAPAAGTAANGTLTLSLSFGDFNARNSYAR